MCTEQRERSSGSTIASFDVDEVDAALTGSIFAGRLHFAHEVGSTQTQAVADAQRHSEAGHVYVANEQTAGRGRGGHTWHSEPGSGLYTTILVRPRVRAEQALLISLVAGLAAQAAVQQVSNLPIDLRWPNDLVTWAPGSLKLGGILTESSVQPDGQLRFAAIGIGINLNQAAMPVELRDVSTSLRMLTGALARRETVLIALLRELEPMLSELEMEPATVLQRYAESSSWVQGKAVRVAEGEGYTGVTDGLTDAGLLRVRCDRGDLRLVRHGGVRDVP